jgi:ribonuclease HI
VSKTPAPGIAAKVVIYADGACSGNPGPGGWGAIIRRDGADTEIHGGAEATTNNRMELMAVIQALSKLDPGHEIDVFTDSQYVQKGMKEWIHSWKRRGWKTADKQPVKNEDLWRKLDDLAHRHRVHWHWVKGHDGHPDNERADALANEGMSPFL